LFEEQGYEPDERDEGSGGKYVLAEQEEIQDGEPRRHSILDPIPQLKSNSSSSESSAKLRRILNTPFVHVVALFTWIYVGIEVTIGGWAVTYLVQVRGAGENAGYASSGFFGGLMIGRVVQIWVSTWLSEQMAVLLYTGTAGVLLLVSLGWSC
jgi:fucose permease